MGFLRKALGGGEKAPEWASFMKADEFFPPDAFLELLNSLS